MERASSRIPKFIEYKLKILKNIAFFGYSGHAFVCIEISQLLKFNIIGYYDQEKKYNDPYNLRHLGYITDVVKSNLYFIAIGDNSIRKSIFEILNQKKCNFTSLVHPYTSISQNAQIKNSTLISAGVILNCFVQIGLGCIINTGAIIEHESKIEDFVHIAPGVVIAGNVYIGSGTFIGANSVIKQGVKITRNCIIGAGSVVINDINESGTYVGNPARLIKKHN